MVFLAKIHLQRVMQKTGHMLNSSFLRDFPAVDFKRFKSVLELALYDAGFPSCRERTVAKLG